MPAKGEYTLGEALILVSARVPESIVAQIDSHIPRLRRESRWAKVSRSDVVRDLTD